MSKENPEVGDLFFREYDKQLYSVTKTEYNNAYCLVIRGGYLQNAIIRFERLKKDYKYLGKGKANINELFEVEK